jgi:hypothetical protein
LKELRRVDLISSDHNAYEGRDGNDVDSYVKEDKLQTDGGSKKSVQDLVHSCINRGTSDVDR